MRNIAIYYRVSTDTQEIISQENAVEQWLEKQHPKPLSVRIFKDEGISGKSNRRPGFNKMLTLANRGSIDTIVVYRLDRFSRDANTAIQLLLELDRVGVAFIAVSQPVLNLGHQNPFRRTMLAAFAEIAEIEREAIVARVRAGLEAARRRGVTFGAPIKCTQDRKDLATALRADGKSYKEIAKIVGLSVGSIHKMLAIR